MVVDIVISRSIVFTLRYSLRGDSTMEPTASPTFEIDSMKADVVPVIGSQRLFSMLTGLVFNLYSKYQLLLSHLSIT